MLRQAAVASVDMLPERFPYRDDGCEIYPSCLRCPLPQCKYDDPGWLQREKRRERDQNIVEAVKRDGASISEVASRFSISQRTIFRIIRKSAEEPEAMPLAA